jgi:YfiH family protein
MSWILETLGSVSLWRPRDTPPNCVVAVTSRCGGVSVSPYDQLNLGRSTGDRPEAVSENRRRVLSALGFDPARVATAGQVHGTGIAVARAPGLHPESDCLVSSERDLALAVSAADCLPLIYCAGDAVAVAHSGWRGTAAGMPHAALHAVLALAGAAASAARVFLGPCIGCCCYRIQADVADRFPDAVVARREGGLFLDLAAAARRQLEQAGVPRGAILDPPACTSCESVWCFSHRRDRGLTGRHWGIAGRLRAAGPDTGERL